jgi:hypothetical protein
MLTVYIRHNVARVPSERLATAGPLAHNFPSMRPFVLT